MVHIYPAEQGGSLAAAGPGAATGPSPKPNSKPPKLRTKQNSVIGNILGPAFEGKPDTPTDEAPAVV